MHTVCVNNPVGVTCDESAATIVAGIAIADADEANADHTIVVAPGTYTETTPLNLNGVAQTIVLKGSGQGSTFVTLPSNAAGQIYINAGGEATVQDLTVTMAPTDSVNDIGIDLGSGADALRVTVEAPTSIPDATGIAANANTTVTSSTVDLPGGSSIGYVAAGSASITDSALAAQQPVIVSTASGTVTGSRLFLLPTASGIGAQAAIGTLNLDDSVIKTTLGGVGLLAFSSNPTALPKTINAKHLTIIGNGATGVWARSTVPTARQTSTINLDSSIVRGPTTDLRADATNDGAQGGPSEATVTATYSDWHSSGGTIAAGAGTGGVVDGVGRLDVDPAFKDLAANDVRLTLGSPVVDRGNQAGGGPATDLAGSPRIQDGDVDGVAVSDMGAFELAAGLAPGTTITSGPTGLGSDSTPTYEFTGDAGTVGFECRVDAAAFATCTSPFTPTVGDGPHTFAVRAVGAGAAVDPTPATRDFTVDTTPPVAVVTSGPSGPTSDATPTFTFTSEAGATFACQVDSSPYTACTSPFTTASLGDGPHTFAVRATDAVSNPSLGAATRTFTIDTAPPSTTITKKPAKRVTRKKVKLVFSSEAGATLECSVDGKAYAPCSSPLKLKVKVGKHIVLIRATDAAGNVGPPAKVKFKRVSTTG